MIRPRVAAVLCTLALAAFGCGRGPRVERPSDPPRLPQVRLLVFIVVDQLGWDTLMRVEPALTGGLRQLLDDGVVLTEAHHLHAATVTATGHATLATGQHPRRHAIVDNHWFDRELGEEVYCVLDDDAATISPRRLEGTTVGDWVGAASSRGKVFAASGKDRGAVLLAGHGADGAFWYDAGVFVSSDYYRQNAPDWLDSFHLDHPAERWFGSLWEPLPETLDTPGVEIVEPDTFYEDVYASPFGDVYLAELAQSLVEQEDLGGDEHLDFLGLSFSAPDAVGHEYGPESAELVDTVLRLDRTLGELLAFLERRVGGENLLVVLSSDHGVAPLPEARYRLGLETGREGTDEIVCEQRVLEELTRRFGPGLQFMSPGYLDPEALAASDLDAAKILASAARLAERCPQVADVWTRQELSGAKPPEALHGRALWRSFHAERSPDLLVTYQPWYVPLHSRSTTHGSPWPYDSHVPLILLLPDRQGTWLNRPAGTVDLAPTLATLLGLPRPADLDGVDLNDLVLPDRKRRAPAAANVNTTR